MAVCGKRIRGRERERAREQTRSTRFFMSIFVNGAWVLNIHEVWAKSQVSAQWSWQVDERRDQRLFVCVCVGGGGGGGGGGGNKHISGAANPKCTMSMVLRLKAQLGAPGNKPVRGKVLHTYLSPLGQERVGRAGALVCLLVPSSQRRSDPPPGRRNWEDVVNCCDEWRGSPVLVKLRL